MELALVYSAVFVAGLIIFERLANFTANRIRRTNALNYRLKLLENADSNHEVYKSMVRERALDYDSAGFLPIVFFRRLFAQSGLKVDYPRIALYGLAIAIVGWLLLGFLISDPLSRGVLILLILVATPLTMIFRARSRRIKKFNEALPGALDVVNRSLMSGHPLPTALAMVSREMPDPIGTEFGMLSDELTYGTDLDEAMLNMIERVGAEDLKLLAVSMSVQRGTGGNFVEILENLANVVRERAILRAKVRSLSAEGRITAVVMSLFPFYLYFMIATLSPTYFDPVWESGYASIVLVAGFTIMALGNFILYRMVNFEF